MMSNSLNSELLHDAMQWAYEVGRIHLEHFRSGLSSLGVSTKSTDTDLVTKVDLLSEQHLCKRVFTKYPNHRILSEEGGFLYPENYSAESAPKDHYYMWVIDPLDGTVNYAHGLPIFAVAIGVQRIDLSTPELRAADAERLKRPESPAGHVYHPVDPANTVCGVVYAPYIDEMYYAMRGYGSYTCRLNSCMTTAATIDYKVLPNVSRKLAVSTETCLERGLMSTGFPYDKNINPDNNTREFLRVLVHTRGFRRQGCAAYDIVMVASGILSTYYEMDIKAWDCCAAFCILTEAGGEWVYYRNDRNYSVVAGNSAIVARMRELLQKSE